MLFFSPQSTKSTFCFFVLLLFFRQPLELADRLRKVGRFCAVISLRCKAFDRNEERQVPNLILPLPCDTDLLFSNLSVWWKAKQIWFTYHLVTMCYKLRIYVGGTCRLSQHSPINDTHQWHESQFLTLMVLPIIGHPECSQNLNTHTAV